MKKTKKESIALYLDVDVIKKLKKISKEESCGVSTIGRQMLLLGMQQYKPIVTDIKYSQLKK